jgi:hypothetical protein
MNSESHNEASFSKGKLTSATSPISSSLLSNSQIKSPISRSSVQKPLQTPSPSYSSSLLTPQQKSAQKKKIQSSLKSFIYKYGELVALWLNDSNQIKALLSSSLPSLYSNSLSINKTFLMSDRWKIMMRSSGLQEMFLKVSSSPASLEDHNRVSLCGEIDSSALLHQRLVGLIGAEIQGALLQIKSFL